MEDYLSDFKGIELPQGDFSVDIDVEYVSDGHSGDTNGTKVMGVAPNYFASPEAGFKPAEVTSVLRLFDLPAGKYGKEADEHSVFDSGDISATINGRTLTITFKNFKLNGIFPTILNAVSSNV